MKYYFLLLIFLLAACSQVDDIYLEPKKTINTNSNRVTISEVNEIALEFFHINGEVQTRNNIRRIASVDVIGDRSTRSSSETDTLLYVINYADEQGFVIAGADRRSLPIYAISDSGNFDLSTDVPPAAKALLAEYKQHAAESVIGPVDPGVPWWGFKGWDQDIEYKILPRLSSYQSHLHYNLPFSKYCFTSDGKQANTGCVMVAVEQIMSYYKWPYQTPLADLYHTDLDWDAMNNGTGDEYIARLLKILGDENHFSAYYYTNQAAEASISMLGNIIAKLGYKKLNSRITLTNNNISDYIEVVKTAPVLMNGRFKPEEGDSTKASGHVWVVDGMVRYEVENERIGVELLPPPQPSYTYYNLFHCVWGWGGNCNGYYFTTFEGTPEFIEEDDNGNNEYSENIIYNDGIYYFPNFEPDYDYDWRY